MMRGLWIALGSSAVLVGAALAFEPRLSDAQRREAIAEGQKLAQQHQGYPVKEYLIYSLPDALTLEPDNGSVEAVQVGTPFERTRWASYFLSIQGKAATDAAVRAIADLPANSLEFIVYAHSNGEKDPGFLEAFGASRLRMGGRELRPVRAARSHTSLEHYRDARGAVVERWAGTLTYRFDLAPLGTGAGILAARLGFQDAARKRYDLPLELQRFR